MTDPTPPDRARAILAEADAKRERPKDLDPCLIGQAGRAQPDRAEG